MVCLNTAVPLQHASQLSLTTHNNLKECDVEYSSASILEDSALVSSSGKDTNSIDSQCSDRAHCGSRSISSTISQQSTLPTELLLQIFHHVADCQATLYNISLVCKQWSYCVAPILYSHPKAQDTFSWASLILSLTREGRLFHYGDFIKSIDLSVGKSLNIDELQYHKQLNTPSNARAHVGADRSSALITWLGYEPSNVTNDHSHGNASMIMAGTSIDTENQSKSLRSSNFITLTTSSLLQLSQNCRYITQLNLSYTSLLRDSYVVETGDFYYSCIHGNTTSFAAEASEGVELPWRRRLYQESRITSGQQPTHIANGLTCIKIPIEEVIVSIGETCLRLESVKLQSCDWVTARIIWLFAKHCPNLIELDARGSVKCTVKKLIRHELVIACPRIKDLQQQQQYFNTRQEKELLSFCHDKDGADYFISGEEDISIEEVEGSLYVISNGDNGFSPISSKTVFVIIHDSHALEQLRRFWFDRAPLNLEDSIEATFFHPYPGRFAFYRTDTTVCYRELLDYRLGSSSRIPRSYYKKYSGYGSIKEMVFKLLQSAKRTRSAGLSWFKEEDVYL